MTKLGHRKAEYPAQGHTAHYALSQRFSTTVSWHTGVPQEFLQHATPDYLDKDTEPRFLRLSNKKVTTANVSNVSSVDGSKLIFCEIGKRYIFFGEPQNFSN